MKWRTRTMKNSPCKECEKRYAGCHSNCEKFTEWKRRYKEQRALEKSKVKKQNDFFYKKRGQL